MVYVDFVRDAADVATAVAASTTRADIKFNVHNDASSIADALCSRTAVTRVEYDATCRALRTMHRMMDTRDDTLVHRVHVHQRNTAHDDACTACERAVDHRVSVNDAMYITPLAYDYDVRGDVLRAALRFVALSRMTDAECAAAIKVTARDYSDTNIIMAMRVGKRVANSYDPCDIDAMLARAMDVMDVVG